MFYLSERSQRNAPSVLKLFGGWERSSLYQGEEQCEESEFVQLDFWLVLDSFTHQRPLSLLAGWCYLPDENMRSGIAWWTVVFCSFEAVSKWIDWQVTRASCERFLVISYWWRRRFSSVEEKSKKKTKRKLKTQKGNLINSSSQRNEASITISTWGKIRGKQGEILDLQFESSWSAKALFKLWRSTSFLSVPMI